MAIVVFLEVRNRLIVKVALIGVNFGLHRVPGVIGFRHAPRGGAQNAAKAIFHLTQDAGVMVAKPDLQEPIADRLPVQPHDQPFAPAHDPDYLSVLLEHETAP